MLRKVLISIVLFVLIAGGALIGLIVTNSDIIIDKFNAYVKTSTGAPLVSETRPTLTLFPNRGLELGASSWQSPDGSLSFSFSRASVMIASHALLTGKFSIKLFSVDDLVVSMQLKKPLSAYLEGIPARAAHRVAFNELIQSILYTLRIAPDNIRINRGRICFIQPDGSSLTIAPLALNASNVHPGANTNFSLTTDINLESPSLHAGMDLQCSAEFNKDKASFVIEKAMLTPGLGVSFREYLTLSGELEYNFVDDELKLSQLHFQGPDLSATASGSIASLARMYSDPVKGDATLKIDLQGDPQRLGEILHQPLPFEDSNVFSDCALAAEMRWVDGRLSMKSIQGRADALTFTGDLGISLSPFAISGELHLSDLDIGDYKSESPKGSNKLESRDFTRWPRMNLLFSAEHVRCGHLHLENVRTHLSGQNGSYELNPLSAFLSGSPVTASMKTVMLPTTPLSSRLSVNLSVPQANLEDIALLFADKPLIRGTGSINASLAFITSRGLPSLRGKGSITSSQLETAFSVLPPDISMTQNILSANRFDKFFLSFSSKEGILSIERLSLGAARLSLSGSGTISLAQKTVKAEGSLQVAGSPAMPIRLEGDLREPKYSLKNSSLLNHAISPLMMEPNIGLSKQVQVIPGK